MTYRESVRYLYSLGNELKAAKFGLGNITAVLAALGDPHRIPKFIHVAGTNGKGSTCAMIEAGLRSAGVRTGLYTSPHLIEPVERIRIDGLPIGRDDFAALCARVVATGLPATYFETVTAMAFLAFARETGIVVLETGLGGRLDATNVVLPEISVITSIDFDHQAYLGHTLTEIASEKAGIMKPGIPAVISSQHPEAMRVLERHAPLYRAEQWPLRDLHLTQRGSEFTAGDLHVRCPLAGAHQTENARTAAVALHVLGVSPAGIAEANWPGRLQFVYENVIVDGAHNPAGAQALASYIRQFFADSALRLIFGAMQDKAVGEMCEILFPLFDEVVLVAPDQSRAMPPQEIAALVSHPRIRVAGSLKSIPTINGTTFVAGSLFLAGEYLASASASI